MQFCLSESEFRRLAETTALKMRFSKKNTDDTGYSVGKDDQNDE